MIKSKGLFAVSFGMLALLTLGGCLTSDDKDPAEGGANFSFTTEIDVENITQPQGAGAGSIATRSIESECDDGELFADTVSDTSKYVIMDGHLYTWSDGDCLATKMKGSSSTIIGTWKTTSLTMTDSVPVAFRPTICPEDEVEEEEDELLENQSFELTISSTKIKGKFSGKVCFAKALAGVYSSASVEVIAEDCATLKLRNEDDQVATITSGFKNDSATVKFTFGKKTCNGAIYLPLTNAMPICSEDEEEESSMSAFTSCVVESGLYGDIELDKKALAKKTSEALKTKARSAANPF